MHIALISCTKTKTAHPAPARELYSPSHLFRKALAFVEPQADRVYILSAKYGLVPLDQPLEPYEQALKSMHPAERAEWAKGVFAKLQQEHGANLAGYTFEFHTGKEYRANLTPLLKKAGAICTCPVDGLGIGERMQFYGQNHAAAPNATAAALEQSQAPTTKAATPFDRVWVRIAAHAGQPFYQVRGGEFRYQLAAPHSLALDRTNQMISYAVLEQAFALVPLPNTRPVQHLRAPSYLYAILMDPRIRQSDW